MDWKLTRGEYDKHTVAREDSGGYDPTGYAAVVVDENHAALVYISHCSCYGTWACYTDDCTETEGGNVSWQGTLAELLSMASRKADPELEGRTLVPEDYTGRYLLAVYEQLLGLYQPK